MTKNYYLHLFLMSLCIGSLKAQCPTLTVSNAAGPSQPICNATTATLTASHNGETLAWYNASANGTFMGTGSPFTTSQLGANTSYWAESQSRGIDPAVSGGAKPAKSSVGSSSGASATSPWGLSFVANQEFILNSVDVYLTSATAGDVTVNLLDADFGLLQSVTVSVPAGGTSSNPLQHSIPLDFTITPGTYRLVTPLGHPAMNRDLGSNAFPFAVGSVATVTGGTINNSPTLNAGVYYFFYNWNYSPVVTCKSPRTEVAVQVKAAVPQPTGSTTQTFTAGETLANLTVTGTALSWFSNIGGTLPLPDTTPLVNNTTYYVRQTVDGCNGATLGILVTEDVAGTNDLAFNNLKAYPNPVTDKLLISNTSEITSAAVYTIQGQKIWSANTIVRAIDFSGYSAGLYIVSLVSEGKTKTIKVTKQ